jgi:hypothetical protein
MAGPPASGTPAGGATSHVDGCQCPRCRGFENGNTYTVTHGSYAKLALTPRAQQIAEWLRSVGPHLRPIDEPALQVLGLTIAQLERAAAVLEEAGQAIDRGEDVDAWLGRIEKRGSLSKDARDWSSSARRMLESLGLTPTGRAALGLDLALGAKALATTITPERLRQALDSGEITPEECETFSKVWRVLLGGTSPEPAARALYAVDAAAEPASLVTNDHRLLEEER